MESKDPQGSPRISKDLRTEGALHTTSPLGLELPFFFPSSATWCQSDARLDVEKKKMLELCRKMRKLGLQHMCQIKEEGSVKLDSEAQLGDAGEFFVKKNMLLGDNSNTNTVSLFCYKECPKHGPSPFGDRSIWDIAKFSGGNCRHV